MKLMNKSLSSSSSGLVASVSKVLLLGIGTISLQLPICGNKVSMSRQYFDQGEGDADHFRPSTLTTPGYGPGTLAMADQEARSLQQDDAHRSGIRPLYRKSEISS